MTKTSPSALALIVAVAGFTVPALAASSLVDQPSDNAHFNETIVLQQLKAKGIEASDLADHNGRIRATVRHEDGTFGFAYFEPGTLKQVAPGGTGGNTRVLSERDLGPDAARLDTVPLSLVASDSEDD